MPSLVRAACTSLPPVSFFTVSERARRGCASFIRPSHSASLSSLPKTTTRGSRKLPTHSTRWPSAINKLDWPSKAGSGKARAGAQAAWASAGCAATGGRSTASSAVRAAFSCQPLATMAASTSSGRQPARAWAAIQARSSSVMGCWGCWGCFMGAFCCKLPGFRCRRRRPSRRHAGAGKPGAAAVWQRGPAHSRRPQKPAARARCAPGFRWRNGPSGRALSWRRN